MKREGIREESEKNREGKGKRKKSSKKLVPVMIAAMIVTAAMTAFMVSASPGVDIFTIEPDKGITRAISHYNATVSSTETISSLNITIPPGFGAANETMQAGDPIAKVVLYNSTGWYGNVTIVANASEPKTRVDVIAWVGTMSAVAKGKVVNYSAGGTTTIYSPFVGAVSKAELKMPTDTKNGSLNVSLPAAADIRNATISIANFVKNPADAGTYTFTANGVSETVSIYMPEFKFEFIEPAANVAVNMTVNVTVNVTIPNGTIDTASYNLTTLGLTDAIDKVWLNWTDGYNFTEAMIPMVDNLTWSLNVTNVTEMAGYPITVGNYTYKVIANDIWNNTGASVTRAVNVTVAEVTVKIPLLAGWNMISTPKVPVDPSPTAVFGDKIISGSLYGWTGTAYFTPTIVEPTKGYWVKTIAPVTVNVTGTHPENTTLNLGVGWNMIGLPVQYNVSVAVLNGKIISGSLYAWSGTAYVTPTKLEPTKGYWVKTTAVAQITPAEWETYKLPP